VPPDGTIIGIYQTIHHFFIMKTIDFKKVTRLDLEIWDTQNKIKYIKLPTSNKGVTAARRSWNNAAPKGAFMHSAISKLGGKTTGNKCSKAV